MTTQMLMGLSGVLTVLTALQTLSFLLPARLRFLLLVVAAAEGSTPGVEVVQVASLRVDLFVRFS